MVRLVDGQWILENIIPVFPLSAERVGEDDIIAMDPAQRSVSLEIEGTVGTLVRDRFVPLEDAEILGTRSSGEKRPIAVQPGGHFRFEAVFPDDRATRPSTTQLVIRSPGCHERRVPVTRAWLLPRRIALDCGESSSIHPNPETP